MTGKALESATDNREQQAPAGHDRMGIGNTFDDPPTQVAHPRIRRSRT